VYLFKNCEIYQPAYQGTGDVLVSGGRIAAVDIDIEPSPKLAVEVIDGSGLRLTPGFIDVHVHIAGAGGDGGPSTRTPEITLGALLDAGVTTAIGCLGLDGYTRSVASLLMKAKALRADGISSWIYTGSYQIPPPTLTGEVATDLAYIEEIIGVGETAISDHRSSGATVQDLIQLAKSAKIGGMLSGKAGIVHLHMGDEPDPFRPMLEAIDQGRLAPGDFYPTHVNRNPDILEDIKSLDEATPVDLTASIQSDGKPLGKSISPSEAVVALLNAGVDLNRITLSSDACGAIPVFDADQNLTSIGIGMPNLVLAELIRMVRQQNIPLEQALCLVTANPARILSLPGKGRIEVGCDADLILFDEDFSIRYLMASGEMMIVDGKRLKFGIGETT
jgi:beta-aspartyl-dipeptidase (metallo-type)